MEQHVGKLFVNIHDGRHGYLRTSATPGVHMMEYKDRAELRHDPVTPNTLKANWSLVEGPSRDLLDLEIAFIARTADQALRSIERHEPFQFWKLGQADSNIYDGGLVEVIVQYLKDRR